LRIDLAYNFIYFCLNKNISPLELQKIIKELLANNNFISLPTLGSFVQLYEPAKLLEQSNTFLPPKHQITFDPTRIFNDYVVEQYLIDNFSLSQNNAENTVKDFVLLVKEAIDTGKDFLFDSIGVLKRNADGQIILELLDENERVGSTFGLEQVKVVERKKVFIPPLSKKIPPVQSPAKPAEKRKKGKRVFIAFAAILLLAIIAGAGFYLMPEFRFWEDTPTQSLAQVNEPKVDPIPEDSLCAPVDTCGAILPNDTSTGVDIKGTVAVVTDKKKALFYQEATPQDSRTYYIISGSYERIENAQVHVDMLKTKGFNPEIIQSDGRFRVAISKFTDRNRALRELERLRKNSPNESVWLLGL
jgi:cell division protein FtsN